MATALALALWLAALLCSCFCGTARGDTLVLVQVMHRHGARWPIVSYNATALCEGSTRICGQLNEEGRLMLEGLGRYLRERYGSFLERPQNYSQLQTYTRSTRLDRTIQSADALLRGLYPELDAFYPVVNTVEFALDLLLLVDAQMSFHIPGVLHKWPGFRYPAQRFTAEELRAMGREAQQYANCVDGDLSDKLQYMECALRLQDIAASWRAVGQLSNGSYPTMAQAWAALEEYRREFNARLFLYDPADPVMVQRGNLGYNLASETARNMYAAVGLLPPLPQFTRLVEYSAHDTTYMPLASAIGLNTPTYMLPQFGQAFIFETYTNASGGPPYMRLLSGQPPQLPPRTGAYDYTVAEVAAHGMRPDGSTYTGGDGAACVTVEDFSRFVSSTGPASHKGSCYLSEAVLKEIGCDTHSVPFDPVCVEYRTKCPQYGCPHGYVMDLGDLSCVKRPARRRRLRRI